MDVHHQKPNPNNIRIHGRASGGRASWCLARGAVLATGVRTGIHAVGELEVVGAQRVAADAEGGGARGGRL
ncbi:hypothetical protein ACOSQ2_004440 [Xanthoceras sorbifolium]